MMRFLRMAFADEQASSLIEYTLVASLISIAAFGALTAVGASVSDFMDLLAESTNL